MDAIGISRHLPILIYVKGEPDKTVYTANRNERDSIPNRTDAGYWMPPAVFGSSTSVEAMTLALGHVRSVATPGLAVGVELSFLPPTPRTCCARNCRFVQAMRPLEKLRSIARAAGTGFRHDHSFDLR
ncbi:hypothetical protein [Bradyrhizobium sp. SZCCHNR3078]|nr:hypothetical protein [Bradyrhizobium sp. SZCCHNR3078]